MYAIHPTISHQLVQDRCEDLHRVAGNSTPAPRRPIRRRDPAPATAVAGRQSVAAYICSGASIPSRCSPWASTRAVTSLNARRLARVPASGALSTGQCS